MSKNGSNYRMFLNISDHQLTIVGYKHSFEYMQDMVTTNQKSRKNTQKVKRKDSKYNSIRARE